MKIIRKASGKKVVKINRREWETMGKQAGWYEVKNLVRQLFHGEDIHGELPTDDEKNDQGQYVIDPHRLGRSVDREKFFHGRGFNRRDSLNNQGAYE